MRYLIGIDDTDDEKTPGTAALARRLAEWLQADRLGESRGVTRHQLLMHRRIPYTGRNSAVCLATEAENMDAVWETARDFLALESARHANAGLCMGSWDSVSGEVIVLGRRAKAEVLELDEARQAAAQSRVRLEAVTGNGNGVIGAVAAIGLHREGNDGRFMWLPGLSELQGTYTIDEILDRTPIERVCSLEGTELPTSTPVELGESTRAILREGQATLFVEETKRGWCALDKEGVRSLSD